MRAPPPLCIGFAGLSAAGKTTAAEYLARAFDFKLYSAEAALHTLAGPTPVAAVGTAVVDSLDDPTTVLNFRAAVPNFRLIWLEAPLEARSARRRGGLHSGAFIAEVGPTLQVLKSFADLSLDTRGPVQTLAAQLGGVVSLWLRGRVPLTLEIALRAVTDFHHKHGFEVGVGSPETLRRRLPLLLEELGEIARWATRGEGDIAEEHADLLVLLLGNAVALGIDIEEAFAAKVRRILARKARWVHGATRVSHWGVDERTLDSRLDFYRAAQGKPRAMPATAQLEFDWERPANTELTRSSSVP